MLTWMMQSMSNLASAEMEQQYADEIMKQQILTIHQEDAKLESTVVLTDMKRTLSPSVDEVLDMIYIKTQVFRLLRYYSPAPRNIARSDWVTQNITHNMTSSIIQPYGLHSL